MSKTASTIRSEVKVLANIDSTDTSADAKLLQILNNVYRNMKFVFIRAGSGFFLSSSYANVVAGVDLIGLPTASMRIHSVFYKDSDTTWRRLDPSPSLDNVSRPQDESSDDFSRFTIEGDFIRLPNKPLTSIANGIMFLSVVSLTSDYTESDAVVLSDDYYPCLTYGILAQFYATQKDWQSYGYYKGMYNEEKSEIQKIIHKRLHHVIESIGYEEGGL